MDNAKYLIDDNPLGPQQTTVIYRKIGHDYAIWNSSEKKWKPSELACDAFFGEYVFADPISEDDALKIIASYS